MRLRERERETGRLLCVRDSRSGTIAHYTIPKRLLHDAIFTFQWFYDTKTCIQSLRRLSPLSLLQQYCAPPPPLRAHQVKAQPTAENEVGVEDAEGGLVGALLVVDGRRDDQAKGDAGDALQHNEQDDQQQGAFVGSLMQEEGE